jgi:hypothetical protein
MSLEAYWKSNPAGVEVYDLGDHGTISIAQPDGTNKKVADIFGKSVGGDIVVEGSAVHLPCLGFNMTDQAHPILGWVYVLDIDARVDILHVRMTPINIHS